MNVDSNGDKKSTEKLKCGERGSNTRPSDLQSDALPTELSPLVDLIIWRLTGTVSL
uniref:Uncharacterized protein n=1 Tax=Manihot esculenta TaxID=3983 RepID=A0A2C9UDG6_MANES